MQPRVGALAPRVGLQQVGRHADFDADVQGLAGREREDHIHVLGREVLASHALQVLGRGPADPLEVDSLGLEPVPEGLEVAELARLALHGLLLVHLARQDVHARALQLGLRGAEVADPAHLGRDRADRLLDALRVEPRVDHEDPLVERRVRAGVDRVHDLLLVLDTAVEPGALAAAEHQ